MKARPASRGIAVAASGGFLAGVVAMIIFVWSFSTVARAPNPTEAHPAVRSLATEAIPSSTAAPLVDVDALLELRNRRLDLPVRGAIRRELHDSFHDVRRWFHGHEAIDIMAARSTPVVAVEDGTIARLFESKAGGTTVYQFDPTTRFVYYYAHLERYADGLKEGHHVQRGQVLGYVGTSGNASHATPHLHFAIFQLTDKKQWWQGSPINPYEVFK
jgi:peptidoglycan LD-endopeptidase LytH